MKTIVYWFSGTGNSLVVAKALASRLESAELVPMMRAMKVGFQPADVIGLVCPVYAFGLPYTVWHFLDKLEAPRDAYVFSVVTMGGKAGEPHARARRLLKRRGLTLSAGWTIKMPSNYPLMVGAPSESEQKLLFDAASKRIPDIAQAVRNRVRGCYEDSSFPMNWAGFFVGWMVTLWGRMGKYFTVSDKCKHCGLCARVCPVDNIKIIDGSPTWLKRCVQCMACLQWCPAEAIECTKKTIGRKRYHHPDCKASDFILNPKYSRT